MVIVNMILNDYGRHLICAKLDKQFLDYTATKWVMIYIIVQLNLVINGAFVKVDIYKHIIMGIIPNIVRESTNNKIGKHVKKN